ncbi:MAG: hypothetical protein H6702_18515, partial [Myxococcales bacterium]|nr:hypothetical protein [Myxococcales bacterium]
SKSADPQRVRAQAHLCCEVLDAAWKGSGHKALRVIRKPDTFTVMLSREQFTDERRHGSPKEPTILYASAKRTRFKLNLNANAAERYGLPGLDGIGDVFRSELAQAGLSAGAVKTGWFFDFATVDPSAVDRGLLRSLVEKLMADLARYVETPMESRLAVDGVTGSGVSEAGGDVQPTTPGDDLIAEQMTTDEEEV